MCMNQWSQSTSPYHEQSILFLFCFFQCSLWPPKLILQSSNESLHALVNNYWDFIPRLVGNHWWALSQEQAGLVSFVERCSSCSRGWAVVGVRRGTLGLVGCYDLVERWRHPKCKQWQYEQREIGWFLRFLRWRIDHWLAAWSGDRKSRRTPGFCFGNWRDNGAGCWDTKQ